MDGGLISYQLLTAIPSLVTHPCHLPLATVTSRPVFSSMYMRTSLFCSSSAGMGTVCPNWGMEKLREKSTSFPSLMLTCVVAGKTEYNG